MPTRYQNYIKSLTVDKVAESMANKIQFTCGCCPLFDEDENYRTCEAYQTGSIDDCAGKFKEWLMEEVEKPKNQYRQMKTYVIRRRDRGFSNTYEVQAHNIQDAIKTFKGMGKYGQYVIRLKKGGRCNYYFESL